MYKFCDRWKILSRDYFVRCWEKSCGEDIYQYCLYKIWAHEISCDTINRLTRIESYFADHDPAIREVESQLNEFSNSVMKFDRDVPRSLEDLILHVSVGNRFSRVIFSANTEEYVDLRKHLQANQVSCIQSSIFINEY